MINGSNYKKEIIGTYKMFFSNFLKNSESEYFKKTIGIFINEIGYVCKLTRSEVSEFFKQIGLDGEKFDQKLIEKVKKRNYKIRNYNFSHFLNKELNSKETHKLHTEIVLKYFMFKNDFDSIGQIMYKKIHGMIKNTNIYISQSEEISLDDMINTFIMEVINGLKRYRKRLIESDKGHTTKILSYIDRIIRNISSTIISKVKKSMEYRGIGSSNNDLNNSMSKEDIFDIIMNEKGTNGKNNNYIEEVEDLYYDFNKWSYLLKYISSSSITILSESYVGKLHSININGLKKPIRLNLQGFYFFEKIVKNYNLYGKIINSYFDIILLIYKQSNIKKEKLKRFIFGSGKGMKLKFLVMGIGDKYNEIFGYSFNKDIKKIMEEKYKEYNLDNFESKYEKFIYILDRFIDFIYSTENYNGKNIVLKTGENIELSKKTIGDFYKTIRSFEKNFFDNIYKNFFEEHNTNLIYRLSKTHLEKLLQQHKKKENYIKKDIMKSLNSLKENIKIINKKSKIQHIDKINSVNLKRKIKCLEKNIEFKRNIVNENYWEQTIKDIKRNMEKTKNFLKELDEYKVKEKFNKVNFIELKK